MSIQLNSSPIAAQAGKTDYSFAWTVKEPLAADYTLRLIYRDGAAGRSPTPTPAASRSSRRS